MNGRLASELEGRLELSREKKDIFTPEVIESAKKLSGYTITDDQEKPVFTGRIRREGYMIEKYFVKGEESYVIPYLLFRPLNASDKMMIWLHPDGKSTDAGTGGKIERMVKNGFTVLAPDLPGTGELGQGSLRGDAYFKGASHNLWYLSMQIGRSIAGIQAGDVVRLSRILEGINANGEITGYAHRELGSVLLHASAFCSDIENIIINGSYLSFRSLCTTRLYNPAFIMSSVPGALKEYDLTDLAGCLAPRKLIIRNPVDAAGERADKGSIEKDLRVVKNYYSSVNGSERLIILQDTDDDEFIGLLPSLLRNK
jgi:hypothetical protein